MKNFNCVKFGILRSKDYISVTRKSLASLTEAQRSLSIAESVREDMSEFLGSWKFVSCNNFDSYLKELGVNVMLRKLAMLANPVVTFSKDGIQWTMRTETIVKAAVASFTLDNWFREVTIDSRKVTSCFFLEQCEEEKRRNSEEGANVTSKEKVTKLVQVQKLEKDQTTRIERTVDSSGEIMNVKMTINDVISTAVFKKV